MADSSCISLHSIAIHDRGGVRRVGIDLPDVSSVEYTRELDQITGAKIIFTGRACASQADDIARIAAMRHEVVIYRGSERVWEGPIVQVRWGKDGVTLLARDVLYYIESTPLSKDWPNQDGGGSRYMTERIRAIFAHELNVAYSMETTVSGVPQVVNVPRWEALSPPINVAAYLDIRASTGPQGILTRSSTEAFEMTVGEHLRALAEGGLDFATVGRRIVVWDSAVSIGRTRTLVDADFYGDLEVVSAGQMHASIGHISAQRDEEDPTSPAPPSVGNAGGPDPFYGVWTRLVSLSSEEGSDTPTQLELNSQARRQIIGRNPVPLSIEIPSDGGIRLSDTLQLRNLVPGVVVPVVATLNLRPVKQEQRLTKVTVTETAAGESVRVSLLPAGQLVGI